MALGLSSDSWKHDHKSQNNQNKLGATHETSHSDHQAVQAR